MVENFSKFRHNKKKLNFAFQIAFVNELSDKMSKTNLHAFDGTSETVKIPEEQSETETETNLFIDNELNSQFTSSFGENYNCGEVFVVTIDDHPCSKSSGDIAPDGRQFSAAIPARSISCDFEEQIRRQIKSVRSLFDLTTMF